MGYLDVSFLIDVITRTLIGFEKYRQKKTSVISYIVYNKLICLLLFIVLAISMCVQISSSRYLNVHYVNKTPVRTDMEMKVISY